MFDEQRTVYVLRGLQGCGKSTLVKAFGGTVRVFSTDKFWERGSEYNYEPNRIGEAHAWNYKHYLDWLHETATGSCIIDNTNIRSMEINPYILGGTAYGYRHEIITIWCDPLIAFRRNIHGVPLKTVLSMYSTLLTESLPPFWNHRIIEAAL